MPVETDPRDQKTFYYFTTATRRLVVFLLHLIFPFISHLRYEGLQYLPSRGGVILVANHLTNFDVFTMQLVLPRPIFFMAKSSLFSPLLDPILRRLGAFPVYRGEKDTWAIREAENIVRQGCVLGMFPEGTRSKGKGLKDPKRGAARIAQATGAPIIPMAVAGTQELFTAFPRRPVLNVRLGQPIHPRLHETPEELTHRTMVEIARMLPPELRGIYAGLPEVRSVTYRPIEPVSAGLTARARNITIRARNIIGMK